MTAIKHYIRHLERGFIFWLALYFSICLFFGLRLLGPHDNIPVKLLSLAMIGLITAMSFSIRYLEDGTKAWLIGLLTSLLATSLGGWAGYSFCSFYI